MSGNVSNDELVLLAMSVNNPDTSHQLPLQQHYPQNGTAIRVTNSDTPLMGTGRDKVRTSQQMLKGRAPNHTLALPGNTVRPDALHASSGAILDRDPEMIVTNALRLRDVAQLTGLSEQYIINLIERHHIIEPDKSRVYGTRAVYSFTDSDVEKLRRVREYQHKGKSIREIEHLMSHEDEYRKVAEHLRKALQDLLQNSDDKDETWLEAVWSLSTIPTLTEKERSVLMQVEGHGMNLVQTAAQLGLSSEKEARDLLASAEAKMGTALIHVLRIAAKG